MYQRHRFLKNQRRREEKETSYLYSRKNSKQQTNSEIEYQLDLYFDDPKNKFDVFAYLTDEQVSISSCNKSWRQFHNLEKELEEVEGKCPQLKKNILILIKKD